MEFEPRFTFIINCLGLGNSEKWGKGLQVVYT
jgi:hypothetical protein